jgi:hypothetical protein
MAKVHVVQPGEHLAAIAAAYGFATVDPIANYPDNATLMQSRTPDVLLAGDRVTVPDAKVATFSIATGQRHTFVVKRPAVKLRVTFQGSDGTPAAGRAFRAVPDRGSP